jgi:hypothetical protein
MPILKNEWEQKEFWLNTENLGLIAQVLGYVADENFRLALEAFNQKAVSGANLTDWLKIIFLLGNHH